jgi:hypothetical protein
MKENTARAWKNESMIQKKFKATLVASYMHPLMPQRLGTG